jgi:hypothetical protein
VHIVDPIVYVNGELDPTIQSVDIRIRHDKPRADHITPDGKAKIVDDGNTTYDLTVNFLPTASVDYDKWRRMVEERVAVTEDAGYSILVDDQAGKKFLYKPCYWEELGSPVGKGQGAQSCSGYSLDCTPLQSTAS